MPLTSRAGAAAALIAASLVGLLVLPGVALADPTSPDDPTSHPTDHSPDVAPSLPDTAAAQAHDVVEDDAGSTPRNGGVVEDDPDDDPTDGTEGDTTNGTDDTTNGTGDPTDGTEGDTTNGTGDPTDGTEGDTTNGTGDPTDGAEGDTTNGTGDPTDGTGDSTDGEDGTEDGTDDGAGDDEATPSTPRTILPAPTIGDLPPATCTPFLVTVTPEGSEGEETAVALTSQAIDAEVPGWLQVSWEAAAGTELTAIELLRTDGSRTILESTPTGTAFNVLALSFCGTASPSDGASGVDRSIAGIGDETDDEAEVADGDATDEETEAAGEAESGDDVAAPDDIEVADTRSGQPSAAVATASDRASGGTSATPDADEAEVEVLGVQIVAPPRASTDERDEAADAATGDTATDGPTRLLATPRFADSDGNPGGLHPLLLAAAVAAGLIAGVTVLRGPSHGIATARSTSSTGAAGDTDAAAPTTPGGSA